MKKEPEKLPQELLKDLQSVLANDAAQLQTKILNILSVWAKVAEQGEKLKMAETDKQWLKEQFLTFADHKGSCDIMVSASEGRIVEGLECTCGLNQLRVQFETDLR